LATTTAQWVDALELLIGDSERRLTQVLNAQNRLREDYSVDRLQRQVLDVLDTAAKLVKSAA
jgi:hypothetical protein